MLNIMGSGYQERSINSVARSTALRTTKSKAHSHSLQSQQVASEGDHGTSKMSETLSPGEEGCSLLNLKARDIPAPSSPNVSLSPCIEKALAFGMKGPNGSVNQMAQQRTHFWVDSQETLYDHFCYNHPCFTSYITKGKQDCIQPGKYSTFPKHH
jgi:hypothetical protein